jgi:hypothetical protein
MFEKLKKMLANVFGKKQTTMQNFAPKSDDHELCENQDNQGEGIQLPSGE